MKINPQNKVLYFILKAISNQDLFEVFLAINFSF